MAAINAFVRAFWEMPPITRMYLAASVATTLAVQLEIISPFQLYFNPKLIFGSHQVSHTQAIWSSCNRLNIPLTLQSKPHKSN